MGKKLLGLLAIGLVFALVIPVGSAYAAYECKLTAVGFIRIDQKNSIIKGFVFYGDINGKDIRFSFVKIEFDDARIPLVRPSQIPLFVHHIEFNSAK